MAKKCPQNGKKYVPIIKSGSVTPVFKAINDNSPRILHDIHLFQSLIKVHCSRFGTLYALAAT